MTQKMTRHRLTITVLLIATFGVMLNLPVITHAQTGTGGVITTNYPKPGDTQASPAISPFPPTYGVYSNMETDPVAITAAERDSVLNRLSAQLPAGVSVVSLNRWEDAKPGLPALQIVNNLPIQGTTYTIFLPPGWVKTAGLPIVLSGNGAGTGNNQRLWKNGELTLPGLAATTGIIAAYSNAGGTESQGVDENSLKSVGAFFAFIGQNGGDPQKGITAGGSRGGGTALLWAINPLNLPYFVQAVFADIHPTAYGTLATRSVLTYPNLGYIYVSIGHVANAYLYSSPFGPLKPNVKAVIGTNDPAEADARSPLGLAEKLRGKTVVIARGTHDAFFPFWEFLRFDRKLTELAIPHTTLITLGQGHSYTRGLLEHLTDYLRGLFAGNVYTPPPGRFFYINQNPPDGVQVALSAFKQDGLDAKPAVEAPVGGDLPFTAEFASHAGVGNPVDIALCGKPGATYSYSAAADKQVWTSGEGTFDASECVTATVNAPATPGEYIWSFTYNGKPVSSVNTPFRNQGGCGLPATTIVTLTQPAPFEINGDAPALSFGVDEFSAQDASCLVS